VIRDWDLAWIIDVSGLLSICHAIEALDILDGAGVLMTLLRGK
jgi:hypothetical protein